MVFALSLLGCATIHGPDGPVTGPAGQRHRLALLALLAGSHPRPVSRDKLVGLLWPESDAERARPLLNVAVHAIRQALGEDAVLSAGDGLLLNPERVACDAKSFEAALSAGEHERAVTLYCGPFLDGFFLSGALEFERWADGERQRLAHLYTSALETVAERRSAAGDHALAAECWRRLAAADPFNSRITIRVMQALDAAGDRAGALRHAQQHTQFLAQDFGAKPSSEVLALVQRYRRSTTGELGSPQPIEAPKYQPPPSTLVARPSLPLAIPVPPAVVPPTRTKTRRWIVGAVVAVALVPTVAHSWFTRTAAPTPGGPGVAVLPFVDLSPSADQAYFSDGITETLITALSRVRGIRVAARTSAFSFRGKDVPLRQIGRTLDVTSIVEGSVLRTDDRIRISVRLVDADGGHTLWSESYDRHESDVFAVQEEISQAIVQSLRVELAQGGLPLVARAGDDLESYNLYLKGRFAWNRRTREGLEQAVRYFQQSVERSPVYAQAHAGLADAYAVQGFYDYLPPAQAFENARAAAQRALALDPACAEPHTTLGYVSLYYDWKPVVAESSFKEAIRLAPRYSVAHQWYGNLLTATTRFAEAEREMREAQQLDPLSLIASAAVGWVYYYAGRDDAAISQFQKTLELDQNFALAHQWLGWSYLEKREWSTALRHLHTAVSLSPASAQASAALAYGFAASGQRDSAQVLLDGLLQREEYVPSYEIAKIYLALGDKERALAWLERAREQRSHSIAFLRVDPQLRALRDEPGFHRIMQAAAFR